MSETKRKELLAKLIEHLPSEDSSSEASQADQNLMVNLQKEIEDCQEEIEKRFAEKSNQKTSL